MFSDTGNPCESETGFSQRRARVRARTRLCMNVKGNPVQKPRIPMLPCCWTQFNVFRARGIPVFTVLITSYISAHDRGGGAE